MRINHNIAALNTYRQLTAGTNAASKNMEKLSSGLRINRAGDDAAGLAISEKMRGQIRGLEQASRNAQDAISLIQTAEGALNETHAILQRMRELAVQAANDTNTNDDRAKLQAEVDELAKEITRISDTTEFNTQKLLDGTFTGVFHIGANENQNITLSINGMDSRDLAVARANTTTYSDFSNAIQLSKKTTASVAFEVKVATAASATPSVTVTSNKIVLTLGTDSAGAAVALAASAAVSLISNNTAAAALVSAQVKAGGDNSISAAVTSASVTGATTYDLTKGISVSTQADANAAITVIDNAIKSVSNERSKLGAYQNRLEHTINNLGTSAENLTASESRIRDVDMAKEMMEFTKNNILSQAAQAMLAQANQQPQGVLQLLR
jgi:flagellin